MFVDKATIHIMSGSGGNGMVAWRREKYVPFGGPAGGDGGRGGDVFIEATSDLNTLMDFKYMSIFKAEDGEKGGIKNMHGKNGKDLTIRVPCGTIIRDADNGDAIADLREPGDRVLVAAGGRGGRGNSRFTSSKRQAPQFSEPGEPAIERNLELELKLLAQVGIIGLPNAGKSTLISVISAAKPKIADYPFTTLVPNLGVVKKPNGDGIVVADIPGLVEGASEGIGLGHEFLRHVERTRLLLHLVDLSAPEDTIIPNFDLINTELAKYSQRLAQKPQVVVLSKIDAVPEEVLEHYRAELAQKTQGLVFAISSVTHQGIDPLLHHVFRMLEELPPDEEVVPLVADLRAFDNDDSHFEIHRKGKVFNVVSGKIDRLFSVTDMKNREASQRLMNIIKAMGVYKELARQGAEEGHIVQMAGLEFDYYPDDEDAMALPLSLED
ncbi:GTPase ObgE [Vampirovibrio chlorellavorus]|uniref:GTPase ObgE n=1 Tax=Vampirovibrio chlorellavorus TaxID=758823 RepID=UPI0026ED59B3|nr:GTPase ObgE [Vampirovibrio chlorellavorus]